MIDCKLIVIGISKAYQNGAKRLRKKGLTKSKPVWKLYYREDQLDKLRTKWLRSAFDIAKIPFYKANIRRLRTLICLDCSKEYQAYVKNDKERIECPFCNI